MMIRSGCFVVLSTLMVLARSFDNIAFESMPLDLQDYWGTEIQSCDMAALALLHWNCYMYYNGKKSPFTALNVTPPKKTNSPGRHAKQIIPFLNHQCCRNFCTRWALVRNCLPDEVSGYMPQPENYNDFAPYGVLPTTTANTADEATTTTSTTSKIEAINWAAPVTTADPTSSTMTDTTTPEIKKETLVTETMNETTPVAIVNTTNLTMNETVTTTPEIEKVSMVTKTVYETTPVAIVNTTNLTMNETVTTTPEIEKVSMVTKTVYETTPVATVNTTNLTMNETDATTPEKKQETMVTEKTNKTTPVATVNRQNNVSSSRTLNE